MSPKLYCGVDEAGRGPVVGPMVLAVAVFDKPGIDKLSELNVRDSKKITPKRREHLEPLVKQLAVEWATVHVTAGEIDKLRKNMSLNQIEAEKTSQIITSLESNPFRITVDACDNNAQDYGRRITKHIHGINQDFRIPEFVSEHKADDKYLEVGAASIIAKVERDRVIEELKHSYGDFGSGYPADPQTQAWLTQFRGKQLPPIIRKSWNTVSKKINQTLLGDY